MCTVVVLRRPGHAWPILIAANRDEMAARPARPPGRHWPDRPDIVAGFDELAGGSWMGLNDDGVVACVLNRPGTLGPDELLRSRGELVLEALDNADAAGAETAFRDLDASAYRGFNLIVADDRDAWWIKGEGPGGGGAVHIEEIPEGLGMVTAHDFNDPASPRIRHYLPQFRAAPAPDPDSGQWNAWIALLAAREHEAGSESREAMTIVTSFGFGTVSSALLALPRAGDDERGPQWLYADGKPGEAPFEPVER